MTTADVRSAAFTVDITATTEIDAPPERVWAVLADTARYGEWNPFVCRFEGTIAVGEKVAVDLQLAGRKVQSMRPTVVVAEDGRTFEWLGHVGVTGVFDGRHRFLVEPSGPGRTRFVQSERLSGALVPAFRGMLTTATPAAFVAMNDALAARVQEVGHRA